MFKRTKVGSAVLAALGGVTLMGSSPVFGQQELQRVEVTGSNIKRVAKEGSSPIEVLTAKDIKDSGAKTVLELMKQVPAIGADGYNDTPTQNGFSRGVATASLRSLSATSTLILLNGRRMTPSAYANPNNGTSTLYDLNTIPISALDRVEIFKDGASAIYGSDAIGGVINFITRSDYKGVEISARTGANDDGEFRRNSVSIAAGVGDFAADGYNFFISADLSRKGSTVARNGSNDIAQEDYRAINLRLNPYNSSFTRLPFFTKESARGSLSFPQTTAGARVVNVTAGCDPAQLITGGAVYGISGLPLLNRTFCNFDLDQYTEAQNKGEDLSFISRGTIKITNSITGFVELGASKSDRTYLSAARATSGLSPTTNFLGGGLSTPFQAILEVGHPDNPFNNDAVPGRAAVGIRAENFGGGTDLTNTGYRGLAGVKGEIKGWDWETALLWNRSERKETAYGFLYLPTLRQILGAPGPNSGKTLATVFSDPTLSRPLVNRGVAEILQWDAKASTEFGQLPGGPIGFAFGAEVREEKLNIDPDAANAAGDILGLATTIVSAKRTVKSGFFEFRAPFFKTFEMDLAGRWDAYPGIKTNFVPKVGAKWTATDTLAFRGTYAEGFRAPAVSQVAPGGAQFFLNGLQDPVRCENDGVTPKPGAQAADCARSASGVGGANPALVPETSKSHSIGLIFSPLKGLDILVDYYKIKKVGEVALGSAQDVLDHPDRYPPSATTRDTNPANLLNGQPGTGPLLSVATPWTNQGSTEVSGIDVEVKGTMPIANVGKLSASLRGTYALTYKREEQPGYPVFNVVGTNGGLADWATSGGDIPRVKLRFASALETGPHQFTGAVNYVSSISQVRRYDGSVTPAEVYSNQTCHWGGPSFDSTIAGRNVLGVAPTATNGRDLYINRFPNCNVPAWTTFDVGYTFSGIKDLSISLNVANVFDKKAPYTPGTNTSTTVLDGYNAGLYNNTGRYFTLAVNYKFK